MTLSCARARALVSDYLDGDLDPVTARDLEQHLETCRNCPPVYQALVAVKERIASPGVARGDDTRRLAEQVRRALT